MGGSTIPSLEAAGVQNCRHIDHIKKGRRAGPSMTKPLPEKRRSYSELAHFWWGFSQQNLAAHTEAGEECEALKNKRNREKDVVRPVARKPPLARKKEEMKTQSTLPREKVVLRGKKSLKKQN